MPVFRRYLKKRIFIIRHGINMSRKFRSYSVFRYATIVKFEAPFFLLNINNLS